MTHSLRFAVCIGCALSAGVHAALIPSHLREGAPTLVLAFGATSLALLVLAVLASRPRHDEWALPAAVAALAVVAAAYLLSRTSGIPGLVGRPEALDVAGTVTTLTEALGAVAGVALLTHLRRQHR